MEGVRGEDGTFNPTSIIQLAENPTLRPMKRLNPDGSEVSTQGILSGYGFYTPHMVDFSFLIFNHSQDRGERREENEGGEQNGGQRVDG